MKDHPQKPAIVRELQKLHHLKEKGVASARAQLANLRSDARTGRTATLLPFVLSCGVGENEEDDGMLFAGLFAAHPMGSSSTTLPQALREHGSTDGKPSPSLELRMRALLSSSREDLDAPLRSVLALAASKGATALNWTHLYHSIRRWDADLPASEQRDSVKRWWARYFWAPTGAASASADPTLTPTEIQQVLPS